MKLILAIGAGGALGALARHYVGLFVGRALGHGFPAHTMLINIAGSFLMGVAVVFFASRLPVSEELRAFVAVGLLGGFTTFSTFSLEAVLLFERGAFAQMAFYVAGSLVLGILALFAGLAAGRVLT